MEIKEISLPIPGSAESRIDGEPFNENPAGNEANFASKVSDAAKSAFGRIKEKIAGRGRGRPKNCPQCGVPETRCQCGGGMGQASGVPFGGAADSAALSAQVVTEAVAAVIKTATSTADSFLISAAVKKTGETAWAESNVKRCQPTETELASLGTLAEICLRKYGVGTEYMPEIGLSAILLGIGARYALAFKTIAEIPDRQAGKPE